MPKIVVIDYCRQPIQERPWDEEAVKYLDLTPEDRSLLERGEQIWHGEVAMFLADGDNLSPHLSERLGRC
jgi:hypothetical protein